MGLQRSPGPSLLTPGVLPATGHEIPPAQVVLGALSLGLPKHSGNHSPLPVPKCHHLPWPSPPASSSCLTLSLQQRLQPPPDLFLLPRPPPAAQPMPSTVCPTLLPWHCRGGVGWHLALPVPCLPGLLGTAQPGQKSPLWKRCNVSRAGRGRNAWHLVLQTWYQRCRAGGFVLGRHCRASSRDLLLMLGGLSVHSFALSSLGQLPTLQGPLPASHPAQPHQGGRWGLPLWHVPVSCPSPAAGSCSSPVGQR